MLIWYEIHFMLVLIKNALILLMVYLWTIDICLHQNLNNYSNFLRTLGITYRQCAWEGCPLGCPWGHLLGLWGHHWEERGNYLYKKAKFSPCGSCPWPKAPPCGLTWTIEWPPPPTSHVVYECSIRVTFSWSQKST